MTRAELIQEMIEKFGNGCTVPIVFRTNIPEVADFIISRERLLLEKIGKAVVDANINERPTGGGVSELIRVKKVLEIIEKEGDK